MKTKAQIISRLADLEKERKRLREEISNESDKNRVEDLSEEALHILYRIEDYKWILEIE
jgi:hypothetical protein